MRSAYGAKESGICEHPATIIVDVANVMGSRPDGWWRDRAGAAVRLHDEIAALASSGRPVLPGPAAAGGQASPAAAGGQASRAGPPQFVMVLEGAARAATARIDTSADRVLLVQAGGSGDDAIAALVRELPGRRFVVTADRELQRRCVAAGAVVLRPGWLIGLFRNQLREP
jgi:8-oxo-dGTP diphosphatase